MDTGVQAPERMGEAAGVDEGHPRLPELTRPGAVWREAEPRLGLARVRGYVGRLRPGVVVQVRELRQHGLLAWVETDWGLSRQMFCHHLCFGYEFRSAGGEWLPESDPRALRWLRRVRDELASGKPERHPGDNGRLMDAATVEKILRRNTRSQPPQPSRRAGRGSIPG